MKNKYNTTPPGATINDDILEMIRWRAYQSTARRLLREQPSFVRAIAQVAIHGTQLDTPENRELFTSLGPAPQAADLAEAQQIFAYVAASFARGGQSRSRLNVARTFVNTLRQAQANGFGQGGA